MNRVDLVGSWERDSMGYRNLVWLSNVDDLDKKLTGKDTWDINILLLRTDHGVCFDGSRYLGLDNGVSWSRNGWRRESLCLNEVLGSFGNIRGIILMEGIS